MTQNPLILGFITSKFFFNMRDLNKVMIIGRLGQDPEVQHFESGAMKASFSVATSESYTNREGNKVETTEWHKVVTWRKLAEIVDKYLRKGQQVYIEGKIKTRSWDDQQTGQKRYITEIEAFDMKMLGGKSDNPQAQGGNYQATPATTNTNSNAASNTNNNAPATPPPPAVVEKATEETVQETDDLPF